MFGLAQEPLLGDGAVVTIDIAPYSIVTGVPVIIIFNYLTI
jgi:acetyltransferase-like isoleucine patch superfamily enzyme